MHLSRIILAAVAVRDVTAAIGFTAYKEIRDGSDNSATVAYNVLDRSHTIFLYIQIIAGMDHSQIINDFKTLAQNYGPRGIAVIPRVRYGNEDGSIAVEPTDQSKLFNDVSAWASAFASVSNTIQIPIIQAGFLGQWGEWHDGPYCQERGTNDSPTNQQVKKQVIQRLQASGHKVALRYPMDHKALFLNDRSITLHNDCIFASGPNGSDGGTFPTDNRQTWVDYTKQIASGNTYGGEGCDQAGDATNNWWDWDDLCGSNGLASYINNFQISYLNPLNPAGLQALFYDSGRTNCVNAIDAALQRWS